MIVRRFIRLLVLAFVAPLAMAEDVRVAAAISLKDSLEAIRPQYESTSGDRLKFTFASSGQLAAQVQSGAPIDLFLSAAHKQVHDLKQAGKIDPATCVAFVGNEMVLIVPADATDPPTSFESLADASVSRLAIGEPKTVPAGDYAQQVLSHLKLTDKVKGKLIYGLNVRQVLQYVQSGEVQGGIVYLSDAKLAGNQVKTVATAEPNWHQPIEYWGAVVAGTPRPAPAKRFLDFLGTEPAQTVFKNNGFAATTRPTTAPASKAGAK